MKKHRIVAEPYASKVKEITNSRKMMLVETSKGLKFTDIELLYNIAKSTGLKSKSWRKIKKRAKITITQALTALAEKVNNG